MLMMTRSLRDSIKTTIRCSLSDFEVNYPPKEAYKLCFAFVRGIQYGSQDAELINYTNILLEEYRMKLIASA